MKKLTLLTLAGASLAMIHTGTAQDTPATPEAQASSERGDRRGGDRQRRDPEEFRQRMTDRLKESLKISDDEWTVIQPLVEDVQTKQRAATGGRFGGNRGGRGQGGPGGQDNAGGDRGGRGGSAESQALSTALESESTSNDEIQSKLTALRESRNQAAAELTQAREELRKVLTLRQEATLVQMGLLE